MFLAFQKAVDLTVALSSTFHRGGAGEEMVDGNFNFTNARRRSNSSGYSNGLKDFKTKFEVNEQEPVFEDHMAESEEDLAKTESADSVESGSAYGDGEAPKPAKD